MQAKLFDSADILIIPHGATFGNVIFAARQSIIVHVSATEGVQALPSTGLPPRYSRSCLRALLEQYSSAERLVLANLSRS